jgi:alpha-L-fucosidase
MGRRRRGEYTTLHPLTLVLLPSFSTWARFSLVALLFCRAAAQTPSSSTILHATGDSGMSPPVSADIVAAAAAGAPVSAPGPVTPTWDSVRSHYRLPEWEENAKFGIFIHWGLFSIPAHHNEWYEKHMYAGGPDTQWHLQHFGALDQFGYKNFIPLFTAPGFDPQAWAALFKAAGARYVMLPAEHHDGFSLWDSALNPWNAARVGPKRDLVGELVSAMRQQGLRYGLDNHSMEHFTFIDRRPTSLPHDLDDPQYADFYWTDHSGQALQRFLTLWVKKNYELIDRYQPDLLWFDNGINPRVLDPLKLEVAAYYYNRALGWGKSVSIVSKFDAYLAGSIRDHERMGRAPKTLESTPWEVHDTIGGTWGYIEGMKIASPGSILRTLIEAVCRNGSYALNISPKGDGSIPEDQQRVLRAIGQWLRVNGEAIYGSRAWTKFGEGRLEIPRGQKPAGTDLRFTTQGDTLYVFALAWPGSDLVVTSLASHQVPGEVTEVRLLGNPEPLKYTQSENGLKIVLPVVKPDGDNFVFKVSGLKLR